MRRTLGWFLIVPVAFVALAATRSDVPPAARATVTVNVTANCTGPGVSVTINPWLAVVPRGDSLVWALSGIDSLDVRPIRGPWPFPGQPSRGRANVPARAGAVPANTPVGQRAAYQITMWCGARTVIIDPEVEVGG